MWHCKIFQRGHVLLLVLVFIQTLLWISWYEAENAILQIKSVESLIAKQKLLMDTESILQSIEVSLLDRLPNCMIGLLTPYDLLHKSFRWWQSTSCTGNFQKLRYYYLVEKLGMNECAIVDQANQPAAYYRITLLVKPKTNLAQLMVQTSLAKADKSQRKCAGKLYPVQSGRQSQMQFIEDTFF